jgi:hypothetical protein
VLAAFDQSRRFQAVDAVGHAARGQHGRLVQGRRRQGMGRPSGAGGQHVEFARLQAVFGEQG